MPKGEEGGEKGTFPLSPTPTVPRGVVHPSRGPLRFNPLVEGRPRLRRGVFHHPRRGSGSGLRGGTTQVTYDTHPTSWDVPSRVPLWGGSPRGVPSLPYPSPCGPPVLDTYEFLLEVTRVPGALQRGGRNVPSD